MMDSMTTQAPDAEEPIATQQEEQPQLDASPATSVDSSPPLHRREPPEPPANPPPRKDGLGARAALHSLRALNPVAKLVNWSSRESQSPAPLDAPRGSPVSSSMPQLPSVAKAPSTPVPRSGRRPSRGSSASRHPSASLEASPNGTLRDSVEESPQLPTVPAPTPPRSQPGSARGRRTGMASRTPEPVRQSSESPVPRRNRPRGTPTNVVTQSAPAGPMSGDANCKEILEVQGHARKLLGAVFEMVITEEASVSILDSYPELTWLANCLRRCPLPPGWTAADSGQGRIGYIDMATGKVSEDSPLLDKFADMGRLMLHWRRSPNSAPDVAAALNSKRESDLEEAARARKVWKGPHVDPETGVEFWHCPATGRSAWGDPGSASEFLARVAERLQKALPAKKEGDNPLAAKSSSRTPSKAAEPHAEVNADNDEAAPAPQSRPNSRRGRESPCEGPEASPPRPPSRHGIAPPNEACDVRPSSQLGAPVANDASPARPGSRHGKANPASSTMSPSLEQRSNKLCSTADRNEVRRMMSTIAANTKIVDEPLHAPRGQTKSARQSMAEAMGGAANLEEVGQELRQDLATRGRRSTRIAPGEMISTGDLTGVAAGTIPGPESYDRRPEFRRRRADVSVERLQPIGGTPDAVQADNSVDKSAAPALGSTATVQPASISDAEAVCSEPDMSPGRPTSRKGSMANVTGELPKGASTAAEAEGSPDKSNVCSADFLACGNAGQSMGHSFNPAFANVLNQSAKKLPELIGAPGQWPQSAALEDNAIDTVVTASPPRSARGMPPRPLEPKDAARASPPRPKQDMEAQKFNATGVSNLGSSMKSHLGSTAIIGQMCAGAIAAAIAEPQDDDSDCEAYFVECEDALSPREASECPPGFPQERPSTGQRRPGTGSKRNGLGASGRPGTAQFGLSGRPGTALGAKFSETAGSQLGGTDLGNTALAGAMCASAVAAAIDDESVGLAQDTCRDADADSSDEEVPEAVPRTPQNALGHETTPVPDIVSDANASAPSSCKHAAEEPVVSDTSDREDQPPKDATEAKTGDEGTPDPLHPNTESDTKGGIKPLEGTWVYADNGIVVGSEPEDESPPSPSLMSICQGCGTTPKAGLLDDTEPSIMVLDDEPCFIPFKTGVLTPKNDPPPPPPKTSPKSPQRRATFAPQTPPRSARGERPVLLGVPQPLSARARCSPNEPPLSARGKSSRTARPDGRYSRKGGA